MGISIWIEAQLYSIFNCTIANSDVCVCNFSSDDELEHVIAGLFGKTCFSFEFQFHSFPLKFPFRRNMYIWINVLFYFADMECAMYMKSKQKIRQNKCNKMVRWEHETSNMGVMEIKEFFSYFLLLNWSQQFQRCFTFFLYIFLLFHHLFLLHCVYEYCAFNFKSTNTTVNGFKCMCVYVEWEWDRYSHLIHNNTIFWRRVNFTKTTIAVQAMSKCGSTAHNNCA